MRVLLHVVSVLLVSLVLNAAPVVAASDADSSVCAKAAAELEERSSGLHPLPEKSLTLRLPKIGAVCLLVVRTGKGKSEALYLTGGDGRYLENLALAPDCRGTVTALGAADMNQDGFPEFFAAVDSSADPGAFSGNRVFWSVPHDMGVEWQTDAEMNALVRGLATPDAMRVALGDYLAALNKDKGQTITLYGRFVKHGEQLVFQTREQPAENVYEIWSVPEGFVENCRTLYDHPGEITARVLWVERFHGKNSVRLELLGCS